MAGPRRSAGRRAAPRRSSDWQRWPAAPCLLLRGRCSDGVELDGDEQDRNVSALQDGSDNRSTARTELLCPAERDQIGVELLARTEDLLLAPADAGFEP